MTGELLQLVEGMPLLWGGNRVTRVPPELADAFAPGDRLIVIEDNGALLHIPRLDAELAEASVAAASAAFEVLRSVPDEQISRFYEVFASLLDDDKAFAPIAAANSADVESARRRARSTTRLELTAAMRTAMIAGLRMWRDQPGGRDRRIGHVEHEGWTVEERTAPLGVVGFVFEGRPNVFADATGVLRTGNTVVFRIGSDALGSARAIMRHAVEPALASAGLPPGSVVLIDSASRSSGWALFAQRGLGLAVARGSGQAVHQLGSVARQAGVPISLHGTGGAWLIAGSTADTERLAAAVFHSLDRKVCNTLNVCCIVRSRSAEFVEVIRGAAERAAATRGTGAKLHVVDAASVPSVWLSERTMIERADGPHEEPLVDLLDVDQLGHEWEWESSPELSLVVVDTVDEAVELFNRWSPRFAVSLISGDAAEHDRVWATVDAPFFGDGFTRWVDGQFALNKPELGLSNWDSGRLFARSGVLSGDSVHAVRLRVRQEDGTLHR